jgi:hypothetical protein
MADVLVYDPASEFEVLERIEFQEEIQRPEELRFFTLDEQLLDYFEKVLPKKKHISKFEYQTIAKKNPTEFENSITKQLRLLIQIIP